MVDISADRLKRILAGDAQRNIMVVGDLMLDRYLWGKVSRISPEAPVPIINIENDDIRFGGAANVANNLIGLQARPLVVGVVGEDTWGTQFRQMLRSKSLPESGLISDAHRPTTIKTRIIGNNQHIARVDRERIQPISAAVCKRLISAVEETIESVDAVILQDYNKGVLIPELVRPIIDLAQHHHKIVTVDPKFENFFAFRGVTVFKPNRKETEEALAARLDSTENIRLAGRKLLERLDAGAVLITLSEKGMALFERDGEVSFSGTRAREVADVSGAGDTVIAAVTYALAGGATMKEAVSIANVAAGVVCEEVGVIPIRREQLFRAMM